MLGICGGQQLINVVLGGTLLQHIPDVIDSDINHEQPNPRNEPSHFVHIKKKNTILFNFVKCSKMFVNSAHHQAVDRSWGRTLLSLRFQKMNVIEAIESTRSNYCLGVQWHPEFLIDNKDINVIKSLITSAKKKLTNKLIRLSKLILHAGICSEENAEFLIKNGDVKINDNVFKEFLLRKVL